MRPLRNPTPSAARSSVALALSLLFASSTAAGQAIAIVVFVDNTEERDAFFAAYSLYLPFVLWAASLRVSMVPLIATLEGEQGLHRAAAKMVGTALSLGLALCVSLILLSPLAAAVFAGDLSPEAEATALLTLVVLAPTVALHFAAASLAAVMGAARRFAYSAAAYAAGGVVGLVAAVVLLKAIGVLGASIGLLSGATVIAGAHAVQARRLHIRPRIRFKWLRAGGERLTVMELLAGAGLLFAQQINLSLALAALPPKDGAITSYALAFFFVSMALNVSFSPIGFVLMPQLVEGATHGVFEAARRQLVAVAAHAFLLLFPILAFFLAFGHQVLSGIFRPFMDASEIDVLFRVGTVFAAMAVPYGLFLAGGTIILGVRRWQRTLGVAAASVVAQAAAVGLAWGRSTETVAIAHSTAATASACLLLASIFGRTWWLPTLGALRTGLLPAGLAAGTFFVARIPAGGEPGFALGALCVTAAAVVYAGLAFALSPTFRQALRSLARRSGTGPAVKPLASKNAHQTAATSMTKTKS